MLGTRILGHLRIVRDDRSNGESYAVRTGHVDRFRIGVPLRRCLAVEEHLVFDDCTHALDGPLHVGLGVFRVLRVLHLEDGGQAQHAG